MLASTCWLKDYLSIIDEERHCDSNQVRCVSKFLVAVIDERLVLTSSLGEKIILPMF